MRRKVIIEFDDSNSPTLKAKPARNLKRIFRTIADQMNWGDTERVVQDGDGNTVGRWRLTTE